MTLPVPTPRTWTVGDIATAALLNSNVRDAVNFLAGRPVCVANQTTGQSIANGAGATVAVAFDTNIVDTYGGHSTTTNNSRYTAQVAGWYDVSGTAAFPSNTAGGRSIEIYVNDTPFGYTRVDFSPGANASGSVMAVRSVVYLNVGDFVEIKCGQTSGGALTLNGGQSQMTVTWVHS